MSRKIWKAQIALAAVAALVLVPLEAKNSYLPTCMNEAASPEFFGQTAAVVRMGTCTFGSSSCCAGEPEEECSRGWQQKSTEKFGGQWTGVTFARLDRPHMAAIDRPQMSATAATQQPEMCRSAAAFRLPTFTISGVWSEEELLLLDNPQRVVLRYSDSGRWLGELPGVVRDYLMTWMPKNLLGAGEGKFLIQADANRFAEIDATYSFEGMTKRSVDNGAVVAQMLISTLAQGRPSGVGDIVGFASVRDAKGNWERGFVRFPIDGSRGFRWLVRGVGNAERDFYKLSLPLVTSIDDTAYFIRMENPITLYRHTRDNPEPREMTALGFYAEKHPLPHLPRLRRDDFPHALSIIGRSSMPVGLYAFDRKLYVLVRDASRGETFWSLLVVDPAKDAVDRTLSLSFVSGLAPEHLTVIPGPRKWAILLKGPATGLVSQPVYRLVLADAQAFRSRSASAILCE